ncbi:MAG: ATPase, partial [Clostridiales bacterium]|nr:ATPase [Clostridiales bacterium]
MIYSNEAIADKKSCPIKNGTVGIIILRRRILHIPVKKLWDYLTTPMYPMDFEEFLWAIGDEITADTIKMLLKNKKTAGNALHRNLMRVFRLYMLIGGMPQAIETYIEQNNLQAVDEVKREIVDLYEEDFIKIDGTGLAGDIYDAIPANLSGNASRYVLS